MGLDLGQKRIGVALSDSEGAMALPFDTVVRGGDRREDHRRIAAVVEETGAEVVVVGLPRSLDGSLGPAARRAAAEVRELRGALEVPVETHDERFTTVSAEQLLRQAELGGRRRRRVVDSMAAAVMLQGWLDHRRGTAGADDDRTDDD